MLEQNKQGPKTEGGHRSTVRISAFILSDVRTCWKILNRGVTCFNSHFKGLTLAFVLGINTKRGSGQKKGPVSRLLQESRQKVEMAWDRVLAGM